MQGQLQFSAKLWPSFGEVLTGPKIQLGGFQEGLLIVGYLRRHGCAAEGGRRGPRSTTAGRVQVADTSTTWPTRQSLPPPAAHHFLISGAMEMPMPVPMAMGPPTAIACTQVGAR